MKLNGVRTKLALAIAGAVTAAMVMFAGIVVAVVGYSEASGTHHDLNGDAITDAVERVIFAILLVSPFVISGAAGLGLLLARRALAPMREASIRARAARASELDLSLPVSGSGDEWDELAVTLNSLLGDARLGLQRVRMFTANAAHELKTPLTVILGTAEVAARKERGADEYRGALKEIHDEAERMSRLVEALLVLARADAGILIAEPRPIDVAQLCKDAVARAGKGRDATLSLSLTLPPTTARTQGDPVLLGRVLDNLLENAFRYGAAPVTVTVAAEPSAVTVDVLDSGHGITEGAAAKLFERFARGENKPTQGHGLGLSISRAIAIAHKGALELVPRGGGACFRLTLPAL